MNIVNIHTSYSLRMDCVFSARQKDNVLQRRIDIIILKKEELVNSILLKSREFCENPNSSCKCLLYYKIFLPSDLQHLVLNKTFGSKC